MTTPDKPLTEAELAEIERRNLAFYGEGMSVTSDQGRLLASHRLLSAEVAKVTAHRDRVRDEYDKALALCEVDLRKCDAEASLLRGEVERLQGVLTFYANRHSWRSSSLYMCGHIGQTMASVDGGDKARAALSGEGQ